MIIVLILYSAFWFGVSWWFAVKEKKPLIAVMPAIAGILPWIAVVMIFTDIFI